MSVAPVAAALLGGIVQTAFGWRANFIIIVGIGLVAAMAVWRSLPETLHPPSANPFSIVRIVSGYRGLLRNRAFVAHLGIVAASYSGLFAWISGSPFVLQDLYGLSAFGFAAAFAIACVGSLAGAAVAALVVMRIGLDLTIGLGTLALAGGGLAMVVSLALGWPPITSLVLSMALYHTGLMLAMPQAVAGAVTPFPDRAGTASSFVGVVQQTSAALLGMVVGYTLGQSAWPLAGAIAAMGCLSFVLWAGSRSARNERLACAPPAMISPRLMV
jgi:DHA1 family bicyclomycin/chloramphenicol resistance-like MFS transporter